MSTSLTAQALFLDGCTDAAQALREQIASAFLAGGSPSGSSGIAARPGVRPGIGTPLAVSASSGMNVAVAAGVVFIQGTASTTAGIYTLCLDTGGTLTIAAADATNPRLDNIIARVTDVGSSSSTATVEVTTGTPGASPSPPALPANALLLARIAVAANATSIVSGNITDKRVYTAAVGGIVPMDTSGGITGPAGQYAHDIDTGRLMVSDGSGGAAAPQLGPFAPVSGAGAASVNIPTSAFTSMVAASVTTDADTEIEIEASWLQFSPASGTVAGDFVSYYLSVDGTNVNPSGNPTIYRADSNSLNGGGGGSIRRWSVPGAGAHTVELMARSGGHQFAMTYPSIRVAPVIR